MSEQNTPKPEGAEDWHPMVKATRVVDPDNENFGKSRIDSPEAADIVMAAASKEAKTPDFFASRDDQLKQETADAAAEKPIEVYESRVAKKGIVEKAWRKINKIMDPLSYQHESLTALKNSEEERARVIDESDRLEEMVKEKKENNKAQGYYLK